MTSESEQPVSKWRFWIPLLFQTVVLVTIPARSIYVLATGSNLVLETVPVDPYDLLRGYSQTLRYQISEFDTLKTLPGWTDIPGEPIPCPDPGNDTDSECDLLAKNIEQGTDIYVILEPPPEMKGQPPAPWQPVAVSPQLPDNLTGDRLAIKGDANWNGVEYGLETFYFPEAQRDELNQAIWEAQQQQRQNQIELSEAESEEQTHSFVVEVKVDRAGKAIPVSLWVLGKKYQF
jgi:uncharacterized membrane-anchored protein